MSEDIEQHILRRFQISQKLGKGAYGVVWKAIDRKTNKVIALKKVFDAFHNATDAQRTYREVVFLQQLTAHENIIKLHSIIKAENNKDLYMVFDHMETDLHAVNRAGILEDVHRQYVIYQTLKALKYMHSGELIHRDLKPSNILINSQCHTKIADFGLARSVAYNDNQQEQCPIMTEYVATRWYRAPEILLGSQKYSKAVDVWSVGCILGELVNRKAIFPGTSTLNQIEKVMELLGKPKKQDIDAIESELASNIINSINITRRKTFQNYFSSASEGNILIQECQDFLKQCLIFNPNQRMTIDEALQHPYLAKFANPEEEIVLNKIITIPMDENTKFNIKDYREMLYRNITESKKEVRKRWQEKYFEQYSQNKNQAQSEHKNINKSMQETHTKLQNKLMQNTSVGNIQQDQTQVSQSKSKLQQVIFQPQQLNKGVTKQQQSSSYFQNKSINKQSSVNTKKN